MSIGHVGLELPLRSPLNVHGLKYIPSEFLRSASCMLFVSLFVANVLLLFFISAASDTTITGWANSVHTVYTAIGG